jgi:Relaxase/Mobilisation nuclease domain.
MIVKILKKSATFKAVRYNTGKVEKDRGELLLVRNFGALEGMENLRPQDYINYLEAVSARSTRTKYPQFHVAISTKGRQHSKGELADIAQQWMRGMGYGQQPYLLIFHKDTANNHVHVVSTRVGRDGKKISDRYEKLRAYRVLNRIMGEDEKRAVANDLHRALSYSFSTRAQFMMVLEAQGYALALKDTRYAVSKFGRELASLDVAKVDNRISAREKDKGRIAQIGAIIARYRHEYDPTPYPSDGGYSSALAEFLRGKFGLQAVFHGKGGKPPYGYTLIDHAGKAIYKGGEIMPLAEFTGRAPGHEPPGHTGAHSETPMHRRWDTDGRYDTASRNPSGDGPDETRQAGQPYADPGVAAPELDISISDDIDDEAVLGRNRRRKRKARTNTR